MSNIPANADAGLDSDDPDKDFFAAWENSREVNEAKADEYEPEADLDSDDPDKEFFVAWGNSREVRSEEGTNGPKTANYYDDAFMKRFDDNSEDEAFERRCRNSINPEADEFPDEESQNGTSASSSSSDSHSNSDSDSNYDESMEQIHDELARKEVARLEALEAIKFDPPIKIFDDESIDSNHPIHDESEDEESQNETSVSSPNSDTDYDESDAKREEESKNETPQITGLRISE